MTDIISVVDWSRWQFALTAMYHWLFVPLTLGLAVIVAVMETIYLRTKSEKWLRITKFWMALFAINFVCGVATGIILEFEFGTNWSNYSWFVGDIFGAPLAIEGLFAFFMEATFVVVMLFGWKRVSPGFHLASTWLTAIGATISALWILVANAWMQYPVGMDFNPDTVRNEMTDFWSVALSPVALNKLLHAVASAWALAGIFVIGVSAWIARFGKRADIAVPSVKVAGWVGIIGLMVCFLYGHQSAIDVGKTQPMKLAAMEGLWDGKTDCELVGFGILNPEKKVGNDADPFLFKIAMPKMLSWMARGNTSAYVPGINDIIAGHDQQEGKDVNTVSYEERMRRGRMALDALAEYGRTHSPEALQTIRDNYEFFGYGYYTDSAELVPPVGVTFYSFHIMVAGGGWMMLILVLALFFAYRKPKFLDTTLWMWVGVISIAVAWVTSQAGWVTAEVGRQPWVIQNLMPTRAAISALDASSVRFTFWCFAVVFTLLLAAEISIMLRKIRNSRTL